MAAGLLAEHPAGRIEVVIDRAGVRLLRAGRRRGRAVDLSDQTVGPAWRGRSATVLGDPDQPHTYTYVPDIGATLAALGVAGGVAVQEWPAAPVPSSAGPRRS